MPRGMPEAARGYPEGRGKPAAFRRERHKHIKHQTPNKMESWSS
jgi:hypothetical protein